MKIWIIAFVLFALLPVEVAKSQALLTVSINFTASNQATGQPAGKVELIIANPLQPSMYHVMLGQNDGTETEVILNWSKYNEDHLIASVNVPSVVTKLRFTGTYTGVFWGLTTNASNFWQLHYVPPAPGGSGGYYDGLIRKTHQTSLPLIFAK